MSLHRWASLPPAWPVQPLYSHSCPTVILSCESAKANFLTAKFLSYYGLVKHGQDQGKIIQGSAKKVNECQNNIATFLVC